MGVFISHEGTERCWGAAGRAEGNGTEHSPWSLEHLRGSALLGGVVIGNILLRARVSAEVADSWQRGRRGLLVGGFCVDFIKKTCEGEEKANFVVLLHKEWVLGSRKSWQLPGAWWQQGVLGHGRPAGEQGSGTAGQLQPQAFGI